MVALATAECVWCDRICLRCRYEIKGGWEHVESTSFRSTTHVACDLVRVRRPVAEAISIYLDHKAHRGPHEALDDALWLLWFWMATVLSSGVHIGGSGSLGVSRNKGDE